MQRRWLTSSFWLDTFERTVGAASGAALAAITVDGVGWASLEPGVIGGLAGVAALASLLKSLAAGMTGDPETAGFTTGR